MPLAKVFIGQALKRTRIERHLTQSDLSRLTGLGNGFISELEANKKEPCAATLVRLAQVLEISVDQLLEQDFSTEGESIPKH